MSTRPEPHNPLYLFLLLASLLFVLTALAYAVVPVVEDRARQAGAEVPPSAFRDTLRKHGGTWLLAQVGLMIVLGFASMWLDRRRLRRLKILEPDGTMPPQVHDSAPPSSRVPHEEPRPPDRGTPPPDRPS